MISLTPEILYSIKPLVLHHTNDCKVFFVSDLHYGHDKEFLYKKRGYSSVIEHDKGMVERWNNKITNNDIVFHLGDIMFGEGGETRLPELLNRLNFKELFLMAGNHCAGFKQLFGSSIRFVGNYHHAYHLLGEKIIHFIPNYLEIVVNKQPIVLSHYAIASWNGQGKSNILCHGHSHGSLTLDLGKAIDVGMENRLSPISFDELKIYMDLEPLKTFDHHNSLTSTPF